MRGVCLAGVSDCSFWRPGPANGIVGLGLLTLERQCRVPEAVALAARPVGKAKWTKAYHLIDPISIQGGALGGFGE